MPEFFKLVARKFYSSKYKETFFLEEYKKFFNFGLETGKCIRQPYL